MATSYQPWYVGETFPTWDIPLNVDQTQPLGAPGPDDLTGADITKFTMIFRSAAGVDTVGTGTFSIKSVYPAEILYKPSVADVASAFIGSLIVKALFPPSSTTADMVVYDPIPFTITGS